MGMDPIAIVPVGEGRDAGRSAGAPHKQCGAQNADYRRIDQGHCSWLWACLWALLQSWDQGFASRQVPR